jgi:hypothetical protein
MDAMDPALLELFDDKVGPRPSALSGLPAIARR